MGDEIVLGSGLYMQNPTTGEITRVDSKIPELNIEPHPEPDPPKEIRNGVNWSVNENGTINVNGTANASSSIFYPAISFKTEATTEFSFKTVSKKRCKKLLMGYGIPRNDAEFYSRLLGSCGMRTPGIIKSVVETCRRLTYEER